jgi:poly-beta-1,6-N-acetyl-D-glucosamine synthase
MVFSLTWLVFTGWIALRWMHDLARLTNWPIALLIIGGIALVPGLMNAFLAASLLLDRRPERRSFDAYPSVSILIAAFDEERSIFDTLQSIASQDYAGEFEAIVIDDGSTDGTARIVESLGFP